jgi:2-keto-4-pentenoate hydratase/2-oxohepta-3-ene-1,7-dioic acid hydratase in catechol pathway
MKLVRYGPCGQEKPGMIDENGRVRDISRIVNDICPEHLGDRALSLIRAADVDNFPVVTGPCRFGPPVSRVGKFLAIGLNYSDHALEANMPIPSEPVLFSKAVSCIVGSHDDVMTPKDSTKLDWEVELGVVIGTVARHVSEADALQYVAGYCVINDVSERAFQFERGPTWDKGKGCDTFGPIGPWLVTRDEVPDPQCLSLWLEVNGKRMQDGNTRTMIFTIPEIVSYVSRFVTLEPGDIISTGTPPGVGLGIKPTPQFLKQGDVMRLGIEGLGIQQQKVVEFRN